MLGAGTVGSVDGGTSGAGSRSTSPDASYDRDVTMTAVIMPKIVTTSSAPRSSGRFVMTCNVDAKSTSQSPRIALTGSERPL